MNLPILIKQALSLTKVEFMVKEIIMVNIVTFGRTEQQKYTFKTIGHFSKHNLIMKLAGHLNIVDTPILHIAIKWLMHLI